MKNWFWALLILMILLAAQIADAQENETLNSFAIHPSGEFIALATSSTLCSEEEGYKVSILSYPSLTSVSAIDVGATCQITSLEWSQDGHYLMITEEIGSAYVWDIVSQQPVSKSDSFSMGQRYADHFNPDNTLVSSTSERTGIVLWDPLTGQKVMSILDYQNSIGNAWSPDGQYLATSFQPRGIRTCPILETQNFTQVASLACEAWLILWSPDGEFIVTANLQGISLWDSTTYQLIR